MAAVVLCALNLIVSAQKMPTITIMPSDNWCFTHYYVKTYKDQGQTVTVSNFPAAFQQDPELSSMISKLGQIMTDYGLNVKDAEQEMNAILVRQGEDAATMSKTTGAMLMENDLDVIKKRTILKNSQKLIDFNVYLPSVSSGVVRHSLADSAPSGKTNKIYYGNADTYPST